jgi:hypothetical protein
VKGKGRSYLIVDGLEFDRIEDLSIDCAGSSLRRGADPVCPSLAER